LADYIDKIVDSKPEFDNDMRKAMRREIGPKPLTLNPPDRLTACHFGLFRGLRIVVIHRIGMLGRREGA